jgi:hypothetical protein
VKVLNAFLRFLYDLVIGDCWQISVAVVLVLAGGVALLRLDMIPASLLVICLGAVVMTVSPLIVVLEARAGMRRAENDKL